MGPLGPRGWGFPYLVGSQVEGIMDESRVWARLGSTRPRGVR